MLLVITFVGFYTRNIYVNRGMWTVSFHILYQLHAHKFLDMSFDQSSDVGSNYSECCPTIFGGCPTYGQLFGHWSDQSKIVIICIEQGINLYSKNTPLYRKLTNTDITRILISFLYGHSTDAQISPNNRHRFQLKKNTRIKRHYPIFISCNQNFFRKTAHRSFVTTKFINKKQTHVTVRSMHMQAMHTDNFLYSYLTGTSWYSARADIAPEDE